MIYLPFIIIITAAFFYYLYQKSKVNSIKQNGVSVVGVIVHNNDGPQYSNFRLGGNINTPTIRFTTIEGNEITGKPVNGFISQSEIVVPSEVCIIYDSTNPKKFFVDVG